MAWMIMTDHELALCVGVGSLAELVLLSTCRLFAYDSTYTQFHQQRFRRVATALVILRTS